jgi:hypothetical protein
MNETAADDAPVMIAEYQTNEFDRKRIELALADRKRYRYVSPSVEPVGVGYVVRSPCCSRNVDPSGGMVDVALLQYGGGPRPWGLYQKDHESQQWRLHTEYERLTQLLEHLNADPTRRFWQ